MGTFKSATAFIQADGFSAENITFENTFGKGGQALAINVTGDRAAFRNCRFLGWQDTMLLLQRPAIPPGLHHHRRGRFCLRRGHRVIPALPNPLPLRRLHHRGIDSAGYPYGFVFADCAITAEPGVATYLGRPWRPFSSVTFLSTSMSAAIHPEGWHTWNNNGSEKTARYAEWQSTGPGANPGARVPWSRQLTDAQARAIIAGQLLGGWNPAGAVHGQ